jgi:hypothetical protein
VLAKTSIVKLVFAALSSVPSTVTPPANVPSRTGWFWPRFEPPSASPASFALTPEPLMSMPSAPLSWMTFERIALPGPALIAIRTPALALWAMTFGPGPPTSAFVVPLKNRMPWRPFGTAVTPSAPSPTRLPWITQPVDPAIPMPSLPLPATTLPAPAAVPPTVVADVKLALMPAPVFGRAARPVASVPIQLPTMTFGVACVPDMEMPVPLPEIRLRALAVQPPTSDPPALAIEMPADPAGLADAVPATFVPM